MYIVIAVGFAIAVSGAAIAQSGGTDVENLVATIRSVDQVKQEIKRHMSASCGTRARFNNKASNYQYWNYGQMLHAIYGPGPQAAINAFCPNSRTPLAADALQCRKCGAMIFSQMSPQPTPIATAEESAKAREPKVTAGAIFARFFFGNLIPALIYSGILARLVPWWGGAPEYKGLDTLWVIAASILVLLANCWVPFVSWKSIPNAFFAGMLLPCLALMLDGARSNSRYKYYRLTAYAVPVATCILFCIYKVWG